MYCHRRLRAAALTDGNWPQADSPWAVKGLIPTGDSASDYQMASRQDPALAVMIDSRLVGEPLDPASERKAILQGWDD
jgi:hypothetical protein